MEELQTETDSRVGLEGPEAALQAFALSVAEIIDAWRERLVRAVQSGRNATSAARMATARCQADLKRVAPPERPSEPSERFEQLQALVTQYLRQSRAAVDRASHEIERNRYSLLTLKEQLDKLDAIYKQIVPPADEIEPAAEDDGAPAQETEPSAAGGASPDAAAGGRSRQAKETGRPPAM